MDWVEIFVNQSTTQVLIDSLNYCVANKGLKIYAWVIMTHHIHLIISSDTNLSGIIRDFKKYTSKAIVKESIRQNRLDWLDTFRVHGQMKSNVNLYQVWIHHNHPFELWNEKLLQQRLNYVHNNPVKAGLVERIEDYEFSSAGDYFGKIGAVKISSVPTSHQLQTGGML